MGYEAKEGRVPWVYYHGFNQKMLGQLNVFDPYLVTGAIGLRRATITKMFELYKQAFNLKENRDYLDK